MIVSVTRAPHGLARPTEPGTKLLHLVRHGEGVHNAAAAALLTQGLTPCHCPTRGPCVYKQPEFIDAPLTPFARYGEQQAREVAEMNLSPELVVVSTLTRAIQTGRLAFGERRPPFVALEEVREVLGHHVCDSRPQLASLSETFPDVKFPKEDAMTDEAFLSFNGEREPNEHICERSWKALEWLFARPESEMAVVTHSAFLRVFMNNAVQCDEESLRKGFKNAEVRSVLVKRLD